MDDALLLIAISKLGRINQTKLAKMLSTSQQRISYRLKRLREMGLLEGDKISNRGKAYLIFLHREISKLYFSRPLILRGTVFSGNREASRFLSMKEYKHRIKALLGYDIFPGTLNVRLKPEEMKKRMELPLLGFEYIGGFEKEGKKYGGLYIRECKINGVDGALIIPVKTRYGYDTLEIVSKFHLRKKLKLKDGSNVEVVFSP